MESGYAYPGRSEIIWQWYERMPKRKQVLEQTITSWYPQKSAEVIVSRQRAAPFKQAKAEVSHKDEGLNVRIGGAIRTFMFAGNDNRNASEHYLCEDKPEAESKSQEELSLHMQPTRTKPGKEVFFFFSSMLKK